MVLGFDAGTDNACVALIMLLFVLIEIKFIIATRVLPCVTLDAEFRTMTNELDHLVFS